MKKKTNLLMLFILLGGMVLGQATQTPVSDNPNAKTTSTTPQVYTYVEQMPAYPGGEDSLFAFLSKNLKYPKKARANSIQGTVFISFVVLADGKISDATVIRGITGGSDCDAEALRVINLMPKWRPGKQNGTEVPVKYNLPIKFKLDDGTPAKDKSKKKN